MGSSQGRKVRLIAKIRGDRDPGAESLAPWVSVHKPNGEASETVTISFGDQSTSHKESYEMDYCYEENEGNDVVFSREVKPLILSLFDGCNATIIACGAKGSGKTYMMQGSDEVPGLAVLAIAEILLMAEEKGKLITVSFFEIFQDHVNDLLNLKQSEVLVLKDAQGKIQLKGLSQVPVKSISDFNRVYISGSSSRKPAQKIATELPRRSHKGLVVYVSSSNEKSESIPEGKMNFIDLTGYEDTKRKSTDDLYLLGNKKINKSIYALQNVVYALNTNERHVPFRESKLTRLLQDSLGGTSKTLMVTCLSQYFCQDSIYMVSLASRSRQSINRLVSDNMKKTESLAQSVVFTSKKTQTPGSVCTTVKKPTASQAHLLEKKAMVSTMKGRKLFENASRSFKSEKVPEKAGSGSDIVPITETSIEEKEKATSDAVIKTKPSEAVNFLEKYSNLTSVEEKDASPTAVVNTREIIPEKEVPLHGKDNDEEITPSNSSNVKALVLASEDKENKSVIVNEGKSPPQISARLQEISNNLKLLHSSIPLCIEMPPKNDALFNGQDSGNIVEPKTPDRSLQATDKWDVTNISSPWTSFYMQSSGMKNSLVQEYLRFLNTAGKEELKKLKGVGEKRATYILELREESPEPFKSLDDLKDIGLSAKQIKTMMKREVGELFN